MNWTLSTDRPIFIQIIEKLQLSIVTGVYKPGDKLPSVRDLASAAAVNPNTMQRAFAELERTGLVFSQRTNGRFITEDQTMIETLKQNLAHETVQNFLNSMKELGIEKDEIIKLIEEAKGEKS